MAENFDLLHTEKRNPRTEGLDKLSTLDMLTLMNDENKRVEEAIDLELPSIAIAVDMIAESFKKGGHLIYVGAGTSGRLGIVDASECPPTFGVDHSLVRGIIAGGNSAVFKAVEGAEDSFEMGKAAVDENGILPGDVLVGISAAGRAPFVLGALTRAREIGARTVGLSCNPGGAIGDYCEVNICPCPGPEVLTGSTRLKAGTVQKLVLNMLSTGAMVRTGKVRGNLMINVRPTNEKLRERCARIVCSLADDISREEALRLVDRYGDIPTILDILGVE